MFIALCDQVCESDRSPAAACSLAGQFDVRFASAAFDWFLSHRPADLSSQGSPPFSIKQDDYFHD